MPSTGAGVVPVSTQISRQGLPTHGGAVVLGPAVVVEVVVLGLAVVVVVLVVVVVFAHPPVGPVHTKLLFAVKMQSPVQGEGGVVVTTVAGLWVVVDRSGGSSATHFPSLWRKICVNSCIGLS